MVLLEEEKEDGLSLYRILSRQDKDEKNILNLQTASPRL